MERSAFHCRAWPGLAAVLFLVSAALPSGAEQLRYDSARDWQAWKLPLGAVELRADGRIAPVKIGKSTNAVRDAARFGGGIRNAGSNPGDAALVMDGDARTGWAPDPDDPAKNWFVEVDLGRGVSARSVTLVFDPAGPPFELFDLLLSTGEPETDFIAAPVTGTLVYRLKERFKEVGRHRVTYQIQQPDEEPIQYIRFEPLLHVPGARLAEVEVEAIGDNIALGLIDRGGIVDVNINLASNDPQPLGKSIALVDGDLYERWNAGTASRASVDIDAHMVLDLGAVYWVDQVRVIGGVVVRSGFGGGITTSHYVSRRRWGFRFYELMTSDGSIAADGTRIWNKHFSGVAPSSESNRGLVDHHFDLVPTRYVRIFWKFWDTNCSSAFRLGEEGGLAQARGCAAGGTTDEIQIFGQGHPQQVTFRSPLIDLDDLKNLNSIEWGATTPPGTRVEIRTRSGNEVLEKYTYYDKNGKEVTAARYEKLIPSFRGAIDTSTAAGDDWSPWSRIYGFSGEPFLSPTPRRYLEIDVRLVADAPDTAASLDFVALNFTPPLARRAVGEIYPLQAQPGVETEFTYYMRPEQTPGFDRLALEASPPVHFLGIELEKALVEAQVETTASGFQVTLPQPIRSDQLVQLRFSSPVFLQSTRFNLFLQDSRQDAQIRQRVDPGDASAEVESSTNVVNLPVSRSLFANLRLSTPVLTPNGDGVHDALHLSVDLVNVLEPRPLHLRLFDLAGRLVYQVQVEGQAGTREFSWDGRNGAGTRVAPGLYIAEMQVAGDARDEIVQRLVAVAY